MREPLAKRDQREIVVPSRGARTEGAPRRRPAGPSRRPAAGWFATLWTVAVGIGQLCRRHPGEVLGSVVALGAVAAVSMNALGFQGGRHPAPIFPHVGLAPASQSAEKKPVRTAEAMASVADKAARVTTPAPEAKDAVKAVAAAVAPAAPVASKAVPEKPAPRDTIGEIIRAGETTASVTPKSEATVAQAQRALVKLGYGPLKADGVMGAGTRAAIEKFERDRKLPVKGVAEGRTLRELASRAATTKG